MTARNLLIAIIVLGILNTLLLMSQWYILSYIIFQNFIKHQPSTQLITYFIVFSGVIATRSLLNILKEKLSFRFSTKAKEKIRKKIINKINISGPIYSTKISNNELVDAVIERVDALQDFFAYYLPQMYLAVLIPLLIVSVIFSISLICAIILIVCAPLMILFLALAGMGAENVQQKHFKSLSRLGQHFLDRVQGLSTLQLLGQAKKTACHVYAYANQYRIDMMKVLRIAFLSSAILELFSAASIAIVAVYLGMGFINTGLNSSLWWSLHGMTLQHALWILLLAPEFFLPLRELGTHYHAKAKAIAAFADIEKILALPELHQGDIKTKKQETVSVRFSNVSLQYDQGFQLKNINFHINPEEKIAVVGKSGSGKTTLLNALLHFIEPTSGIISINNNDIKNISPTNYYENIAALLQDNHLSLGTLRENLLRTNPFCSDDELIQALTWTGVYSALPQGLATQVGEQGLGLSRGQLQRVALAQLYIKKANLWLLDEPTSSLDHDSEDIIIDSLIKKWNDKTVILATHHPALLKIVDRIIVLEEGSIVEHGSYNRLIDNKKSCFYRLFMESTS